jgi:hypothetical protein
MSSPINEMSLKEVARYYTSISIITHPLHGPASNVNNPGKQPKKNGWRKLKCPYLSQDEDTPITSEWEHA